MRPSPGLVRFMFHVIRPSTHVLLGLYELKVDVHSFHVSYPRATYTHVEVKIQFSATACYLVLEPAGKMSLRCIRNIYVKWICFEVKWSYGEITMYIRVALYWGYLIVLWLFQYCVCFNLFCNVLVCVCGGFVICGCFGNMGTCTDCVLYSFTVFLYYFVYIYLLLNIIVLNVLV